MDKETDKIKQHIDTEREQLGRNLDEIEYRVRSATDFKAHFDRNTGWILGAAVAGGFLLSQAFRRSSPSTRPRRSDSGSAVESGVKSVASTSIPSLSRHLQRFSETIDDILDGLVGVVSNKVESFVAEAVPGFQTPYDRAGRQHRRSSAQQTNQDDHSEFSVVT